MKYKYLIIGVFVLLIGLGVKSFFFNSGAVKTFDLQVGQERNFELPGVLDNKITFDNDKQIFAIAIYPDASYVSLNKKARIYVTPKGKDEILQEKKS